MTWMISETGRWVCQGTCSVRSKCWTVQTCGEVRPGKKWRSWSNVVHQSMLFLPSPYPDLGYFYSYNPPPTPLPRPSPRAHIPRQTAPPPGPASLPQSCQPSHGHGLTSPPDQTDLSLTLKYLDHIPGINYVSLNICPVASFLFPHKTLRDYLNILGVL